MTGSYFYKKIIIVFALVAFLVGNFFTASSVLAQPTAAGLQQQVDSGQMKKAGEKANPPGTTGSPAAAEKNDQIYCWKTDYGIPSVDLWGCGATVAFLILQIASWVLWVAAILFNATINYTLNMAAFIKDIPIVDLGWTVFRDVTNLLFIFIILYIAINTIVGNEGYGIKKLLGKVIIGAMLINFSLFFTQAMIDASNIFALQFYHKITQDAKGANIAAGASANNDDYDSGISAAFVNAMGLQQIYQLGKGSSDGDVSTNLSGGELGKTKLGLNASNLIIVGLGGTILVLITAFVFFAGTMMLLARTVVLVFLMILSPIAFMGNILPALGKYTGEWWNKLTSNLLFAPVYMMLLYLVINMITGSNFKKLGGGGNGTFADLFAGGNNWVPTLMTFVVLIMLMVGCLIIASKLGVIGGKWAEKTGMGLASGLGMSLSGAGLAMGLGAGVARGVVGGGANAILQNDRFKKYAPGFAMRGLDSLRNTKIGTKSFIDARKLKDDNLKKEYDLTAEVRQGSRETDDAFKARKNRSQAAAYTRLGIAADSETGLPKLSADGDMLSTTKGKLLKEVRLSASQRALVASKDMKEEKIGAELGKRLYKEEQDHYDSASKKLRGLALNGASASQIEAQRIIVSDAKQKLEIAKFNTGQRDSYPSEKGKKGKKNKNNGGVSSTARPYGGIM